MCNAIGNDVMPWLTLYSMNLNLHYRKLFMTRMATMVNSMLLLWGCMCTYMNYYHQNSNHFTLALYKYWVINGHGHIISMFVVN